MDEVTAHRELARATRARALVEDDLLKEAFQTLEDELMMFWRTTKANEDADREKIFIAVNMLGRVREQLDRVITNGKLAQSDLKTMFKPTRAG